MRRGTRCSARSCRCRPPLAITDVRHVGRPDRARRRREPLPRGGRLRARRGGVRAGGPCVDFTTAAGDTEHIVHGAWGLPSNAMVEVPFTPLSPDLDGVFASSAHVVEADDRAEPLRVRPMETRGIVASWVPGRDELDITVSCQSVHETRNFFPATSASPRATSASTARDVGGGFGQKMFVFREECAVVARVAPPRSTGQVDRGPAREPHRGRALAQRTREGAPRDRRRPRSSRPSRVEHVADVGAYPACPAIMDPMLLPGPYRIPRLGFSMAMVWTNTMGKGAYRGPWMFETTAREMAIDHAARRRSASIRSSCGARNLLAGADLPFTVAQRQPLPATSRRSRRSSRHSTMLDYDAFRAEQAEAAHGGPPARTRVAASTSSRRRWARPLSRPRARTVRVESSGRVVAYLGTTSHGQSVETTMAQIVADTLGVAVRRRHRRAGRDGVDALRPGHRRLPHRRRRGRRGARGERGRTRRRCSRSPPTSLEAAPEDLDIAEGRVFVRGTPARGRHDAGGRDRGVPVRRPASPRGRCRARGDRPVPARVVPDLVERHPPLRRRGRPGHVRAARCCATSSRRTAGR